MTLHVACPKCQAVNRVLEERLGEGPACGKCHAKLFGGPVALDAAGFEAQLRADLPVLVDFWAPWCGPCKMMAPQYERAAAELEPHVRVAKVDTDAVPDLGARYNIRSIPTLALFQGGRELARQSGAMMAPDIVRWARANLGGR